jgi:hypothetical protein
MTKDEWIENILEHLYNYPNGSDLWLNLKPEKDPHFDNAIGELKTKLLIQTHRQFGYWDVLTKDGYEYRDAIVKDRTKKLSQPEKIETDYKTPFNFLKRISLTEWAEFCTIIGLVITLWLLYVRNDR